MVGCWWSERERKRERKDLGVQAISELKLVLRRGPATKEGRDYWLWFSKQQRQSEKHAFPFPPSTETKGVRKRCHVGPRLPSRWVHQAGDESFATAVFPFLRAGSAKNVSKITFHAMAAYTRCASRVACPTSTCSSCPGKYCAAIVGVFAHPLDRRF